MALAEQQRLRNSVMIRDRMDIWFGLLLEKLYNQIKENGRASGRLPFSFLFLPEDVYLNIKYKLFRGDISDGAADRKNQRKRSDA